MAIQDDILALKQIQLSKKEAKGKYVQGIATPDVIPLIGDKTTFIKFKKPEDETEEIEFEPKEKDYQFRVDVWKSSKAEGFTITAKRNLGDDIIETVEKNIGDVDG